MYKFTVTLNAAYAGETVWNCQTLAHAEKLAEEFRAMGFTAIVA